MFHIQLTAFAVLAIFTGTSLADWGANGPSEWNARCGSKVTINDQYVCFTYQYDITKTAYGQNFRGYADSGGNKFVLVRDGNKDTTLLYTSERRLRILWDYDNPNSAFIEVTKPIPGKVQWDWIVDTDYNTGIPAYRKTFLI